MPPLGARGSPSNDTPGALLWHVLVPFCAAGRQHGLEVNMYLLVGSSTAAFALSSADSHA
jgi:hypothetical protein